MVGAPALEAGGEKHMGSGLVSEPWLGSEDGGIV